MGEYRRPSGGPSGAVTGLLILIAVAGLAAGGWAVYQSMTKPPPEVVQVKEPEPAKPEPKKADPKNPPPRAYAFEEAWRVAIDGTIKLREEALAKFKGVRGAIPEDDVTLIEQTIARHGAAGKFTVAESLLFVRYGLADYVGPVHVRWASLDTDCKAAAQIVWNRVPRNRSPATLSIFMLSWASLDDDKRVLVLPLLREVESAKRTFIGTERDLIVKVAGEDYWLARP